MKKKYSLLSKSKRPMRKMSLKEALRSATPRTHSTDDAQLAEFEAKDLGEDLAKVKPVIIRPKAKGRVRAISLDDELVEALRRVGAKRGLGYQTMLKVIVREHVEEYE